MRTESNDLQLTDVCHKIPIERVEVVYGTHNVVFGNVLTPAQVQHKPKITWNADSSKFYTLLLTDPDAPSRKEPKFREWWHFLVCNIPGSNLSKGEICFDYVGAGPPKGTGLHRYIFLVYEQKGKITCDEKKTSQQANGRENHHAMEFAELHNLGEPKFINVFQSQYDDYVPKLYESFIG